MSTSVQPTPSATAPVSAIRVRRRTSATAARSLKQRRPRLADIDPATSTVFDRLYDEYLPFRLYTDYMLGRSPASLAKEFGFPEHWVAERIEALRLCLGKQVRVNLLAVAQ